VAAPARVIISAVRSKKPSSKIGTELLFPTLPTAVQAYQDGTKDPRPATKAHDRARSR
jgi:hypothetical protein